MDDGVFGIAGGEQHFQRRAAPRHFRRELPAVQTSGHDDVGEQEVERRAAIGDGKGFGAVGGRQRLVAEALELCADISAHQFIILDHQDGLVTALDLGALGPREFFRRGIGLRQIEAEGRAVALFAVDLDVSARLLDEAVDHAQAEPGALADFLGREERLEHPVDDIGPNSDSGIADRDHHVIPRHNVAVSRGIFLIEGHVLGFQDQLAALGHGIARVDRKIEQRRGELARIDQRRP